MKKKKEINILLIQLGLAVILNYFGTGTFMDKIVLSVMQLVMAVLSGSLMAGLMQFYKSGMWLRYSIVAFSFILFYDLLVAVGFF